MCYIVLYAKKMSSTITIAEAFSPDLGPEYVGGMNTEVHGWLWESKFED